MVLSILLLGGGKGVHTFPKGISSKVNTRELVIARLEFELAYYDVTV